QVLGWAEPGVLCRVEVLPGDVDIVVVGVAADIEARAHEVFAVDGDPGIGGGVLRLAEDVGAVVDAVEVDAFAVVVLPIVRRGGDADHRGQGSPAIDVGHHFIVFRAGGDVVWPPHDAGDAPAGFEGGAFFAAERVGAGIGVGVLPRAVIGGRDDDRVRA